MPRATCIISVTTWPSPLFRCCWRRISWMRRLSGRGLQGHVPAAVGHVATWMYLLFAFSVLPVYLPVATWAEPPGRRRVAMSLFVVLGAVVSVLLLAAMARGPVTARLGDYHLSYGIHLHAGLVIVAPYVLATCGAGIFSGYRQVV